jgi:O-acetyl-ADP-ribose deacetylase (regulator of RNase III)
MITFIQNGDLFQSKCEAWVNPCNCVGVAGKGLSKEFKERFPKYYKTYQHLCRNGYMKPGRVAVSLSESKDGPEHIISFPTKKHWKNPSFLPWILDGLKDLRFMILEHKIKSIAIPPLGCGQGRLNYTDVKSIIIERLSDLDCYIEVYEPK